MVLFNTGLNACGKAFDEVGDAEPFGMPPYFGPVPCSSGCGADGAQEGFLGLLLEERAG
jgi:hypothetical protein